MIEKKTKTSRRDDSPKSTGGRDEKATVRFGTTLMYLVGRGRVADSGSQRAHGRRLGPGAGYSRFVAAIRDGING